MSALPEGVVRGHVVSEVASVALEQPLPSFPDDGRTRLVVARLCGEPVGTVQVPGGTDATQLLALLTAALPTNLPDALARHAAPALTVAGAPHACSVRGAAPDPLSVILCTRDRADSVVGCLTSLLALEHDDVDVVVVDNAPSDDATQTAVTAAAAAAPAGITVRYVRHEPPGLSGARNAGIAAARHDLLAFVDDDEHVDAAWATELVSELVADPRVGAVSGLVLPHELATEAQAQFEEFGGHSKGRGFRRQVFDPLVPGGQSPMYPLPPFGVGANMAFRRAALRDAGGFDPGLGAGTLTSSGEDTAALSEVLLAGWVVVYAPAAVTWHIHRRDGAALLSQLTGYGVGLGAYYASLLRRDPRRLAALLRLAPQALSDLRSPDSLRGETLGQLPPEVGRANVRGILWGPVAYARARSRARRALR